MVENTFDKDDGKWCSYFYGGGIDKDCFVPVVREKTGGVNNSGYIWADDTMWNIDEPDDSILAFVFYRSWTGNGSINLMDRKVSLYLRGDNLKLYGAECYFWVFTPYTRWHYIHEPLRIQNFRWDSTPDYIHLTNDESLWYNSWCEEGYRRKTIEFALRMVTSYGISFRGYSQEVKGMLSMDEFKIEAQQEI